jgi:thiol:disulfide interchange protein
MIAALLLVVRIAVMIAERGHEPPPAQGRIPWQAIPAGQAVAHANGKPILYDFTAEWCGPCKQLERAVFADAGSARFIADRFVPIRVTDRQREDGRNPPDVAALQARYDVRAFPTLVVVRPDSSVAMRIEGFTGQADVMRRLTQASLPALR